MAFIKLFYCDYFPEWRNWVDDLPTPRTTMMIDNLTPQTLYSIRLVAINAVGEGTPLEFPHTTKAMCKFTRLPHTLDKWEL